MAAEYNFVLKQGDTFNPILLLRESEQGNPIDLTSATVRFSVRSERTQSSAQLVELTHLSGITLGGVAGTLTFLIAASATNAYQPGTYYYDLNITLSSVSRVELTGKFIVDASTAAPG